MKKSFKSILLLVMVFFTVALIIGCGGGGGGDSVTVSTVDPTSTNTTTPSTETGTLKGTVYNDSGQPMSGATVTTDSNDDTKASTTSDSNGQFVLQNVPKGSQQLTIYKGNYSKVLDVDVEVDTTIDVGSVQVTPSGSITGTVVDTDGNPIPFAFVEMAVETEINIPTPTGTPTITPTTSPTVSPTSSPTSTITPTPTSSPAGYGRIEGLVEAFLSTSPIEGVTITLDGSAVAVTDSSGAYAIENVLSGIHLLTTEHSGYYSSSVTVFTETNMTTYYNFILYPTGSFKKNQGRYSYTMYLYAVTDMNGKFSFPFVNEGTYTLTGSCYGYTNGTAEATVTTGGTTDVTIVLGGGGSIPTPTITPTITPTSSPTYSPTPTPTSTGGGTGTLRIVAYGYEDYENNDEFVGVKYIRVWEYDDHSQKWFENWPSYAEETSYELECTYANLNKYHVVEVEWHNGHSEIVDTTLFEYDGQTVWIEYFGKGKVKIRKK